MSTGTNSPQVQQDPGATVDPPDQTAATSTVVESLTREYSRLRDETRLLTTDVVDGHHEVRRWHIDDRVAVKARRSVEESLNELAIDRGMTWSSIARLSGVSVSALRKWRAGESVSPESRRAVARLAAFMELLDELPVSEPAAWLAMPLCDGYTATAEDLYLAGDYDSLIDFAAGQSTVEGVLAEHDPEWRETYRSDYEIIKGGDDQPLIVRRD